MNKRQLEVQKITADEEAKTIRQLKQVYAQASKDCESKIRELSSRTDLENLQSIVYQKQYQEAIKKQLDTVLDDLNTKSFSTITEYLGTSYENGFFGTLYDLQGQGIPLCFPIDQAQVVQALQTDAKLSKGLYNRLGEDTDYLKKSVKAELSRGVANGESWNQIAGHIANGMNSPFTKAYNNSIRIARTEGHRIQSEATLHCQQKAKEKGADVVKQWDSTLDGATRPDHVALDGQIREVDEPFEVSGKKAMHPSGFGDPSEDCNCRCCLLQRARWALTDEEFTKMNGDTGKLVKLQEKEYNQFKKVAKEEIKQQEKEPLSISNFPTELSQKSEGKNTQKLVDYVNGCEGSNPDTVALYNQMGKLENVTSNGASFKISHASGYSVSTSYSTRTGRLVEAKLTIPKLVGADITGQVNTTLHEEMHLMDFFCRKDPTKSDYWFSSSRTELVKAFNSSRNGISDEVTKLFKKHDSECDTITKKLKNEYSATVAALRESYFPKGASVWSNPTAYEAYEKEQKALWKKTVEQIDYEQRNLMGGGIGNLEDIYDALSVGTYQNTGTVKYGHGVSYYNRSQDTQLHETIANYGSLSITRPDLIEMLRDDKPELVEQLEETIKEMVKEAGD